MIDDMRPPWVRTMVFRHKETGDTMSFCLSPGYPLPNAAKLFRWFDEHAGECLIEKRGEDDALDWIWKREEKE